MKERLTAAVELLNGLMAANQIPLGGQAEVQFKQALTEIQGAIDTPAPVVEPIVKTEVATETMAALVADKMLAGMLPAMQSTIETNQKAFRDMLDSVSLVASQISGLTSRTANIESATGSILSVTQITSDHVSGFQDVLGDIQSRLPAAA